MLEEDIPVLKPRRYVSEHLIQPLKSQSASKVPLLNLQAYSNNERIFTKNCGISPVSSNILNLRETARSSIDYPDAFPKIYLNNMGQYGTISNVPFRREVISQNDLHSTPRIGLMGESTVVNKDINRLVLS